MNGSTARNGTGTGAGTGTGSVTVTDAGGTAGNDRLDKARRAKLIAERHIVQRGDAIDVRTQMRAQRIRGRETQSREQERPQHVGGRTNAHRRALRTERQEEDGDGRNGEELFRQCRMAQDKIQDFKSEKECLIFELK